MSRADKIIIMGIIILLTYLITYLFYRICTDPFSLLPFYLVITAEIILSGLLIFVMSIFIINRKNKRK